MPREIAETLTASLCVKLLCLGYDDEEACQRWSSWIDQRPYLIARYRGVADVIAAQNLTGKHDMPTVACGGHQVVGSIAAEDGLDVGLSTPADALVNRGCRPYAGQVSCGRPAMPT